MSFKCRHYTGLPYISIIYFKKSHGLLSVERSETYGRPVHSYTIKFFLKSSSLNATQQLDRDVIKTPTVFLNQ